PAAARRHTLSREAAALLLDVGGRDLAVRRFGRGGTRPEPLVRGGHGSRRGGARARHGHGGRRGADRGARRGERPDRLSGRRVARPRRLPPRRQRARAPRRLARDSPAALDYTLGHRNAPGKYLFELPFYLLPWTPVVAAALVHAWRRVREPDAAGTAWRFALGASLPFLAVLSLAATARDIYAAPA